MPPIKVEYAKSARSRCTWKTCSKFIEKGELRVGTGNLMPGATDLSYKWRHVCCFTKRQLASVSGVDALQGFSEMLEDDQALLRRMVKGELIDDHSLIGRISIEDTAVAKKKTSPKKKRNRDSADIGIDEDEDGPSPAVAVIPKKKPSPRVAAASTLPMCPFGADCFRKNPDHFKEYRHPKDEEDDEGEGEAAVGDDDETETDDEHAIKPSPTAGGGGGGGGKPTPAPPLPISAGKGPDGRPKCPFGPMCFRTQAAHRKEFYHTEASADSDGDE